MSQSPVQALQGLRDAVSALAQTLYEAESSPDLVFVKSQADAGGPAAPAATRVVDLLARLWERYPLAKDVVERLDEAVAAGRHDAVAQLLGPDAVTLPDGSTRFVGALIDDLRARRRRGRGRGGAAGGAPPAPPWPGSTRAATALRGLVERARAVGAAGDVEVAAATAALQAATDAVAADPTADGPVGRPRPGPGRGRPAGGGAGEGPG